MGRTTGAAATGSKLRQGRAGQEVQARCQAPARKAGGGGSSGELVAWRGRREQGVGGEQGAKKCQKRPGGGRGD